MHEKLLPFLQLQYHAEGVVVFEEKSFYVEHYQPFHEVYLGALTPPILDTVRLSLLSNGQRRSGAVFSDV